MGGGVGQGLEPSGGAGEKDVQEKGGAPPVWKSKRVSCVNLKITGQRERQQALI